MKLFFLSRQKNPLFSCQKYFVFTFDVLQRLKLLQNNQRGMFFHCLSHLPIRHVMGRVAGRGDEHKDMDKTRK